LQSAVKGRYIDILGLLAEIFDSNKVFNLISNIFFGDREVGLSLERHFDGVFGDQSIYHGFSYLI